MRFLSIILVLFGLFGCGGAANKSLTLGGSILVSVSLSTQSTQVAIGTSQTLTVTGNYSDGSTQALTSLVTWQFSPAIVKISGVGVVTGVALGSTNVVATYAGITSNSININCSTTLSNLVSISILATPLGDTPTMVIGNNRTFLATGTYADSSTVNLTSMVTWSSSSNATATISSQGIVTAAVIGTTSISASYSGLSSNTVTVTVRSVPNYLYAAQNATYSAGCNIISLTVSGCGTTNQGFNSPQQAAILGNYVYFADLGANSIVKCAISGSSISSCGATGTSVPSSPSGIAFYGSWAYIVNGGSAIYSCPVNLASGVIGTCASVYSGAALTGTWGIVFYGNYAFVSNTSTSPVSFCSMNPANGSVTQCTASAQSMGWSRAEGLAAVGNYLYLTWAQSNNFGYCTINSDASLSNCFSDSPNTHGSFGLASDGNRIFVSNLTDNSILACSLNSGTGLWSSCSHQSVITSPMGIAIN